MVTGENYSKLLRIKRKKKFLKPTKFGKFQELFGGDKRDRTADLLNAIQEKVVLPQRLFALMVVTWWSQKITRFVLALLNLFKRSKIIGDFLQGINVRVRVVGGHFKLAVTN